MIPWEKCGGQIGVGGAAEVERVLTRPWLSLGVLSQQSPEAPVWVTMALVKLRELSVLGDITCIFLFIGFC